MKPTMVYLSGLWGDMDTSYQMLSCLLMDSLLFLDLGMAPFVCGILARKNYLLCFTYKLLKQLIYQVYRENDHLILAPIRL